MPSLRNHAHCQVAQKADTQTKTCQRDITAPTHEQTTDKKTRKHNTRYKKLTG